jgi:hypothetical protein
MESSAHDPVLLAIDDCRAAQAAHYCGVSYVVQRSDRTRPDAPRWRPPVGPELAGPAGLEGRVCICIRCIQRGLEVALYITYII